MLAFAHSELLNDEDLKSPPYNSSLMSVGKEKWEICIFLFAKARKSDPKHNQNAGSSFAVKKQFKL